MSRCFPYPPPGYEKNGIRDEALIESIKKRQREGEKAKKEKKKEKKREKKEKDRTRENGDAEKKKHSHKKEKRHKNEEGQEGQKARDHDKKRKLESKRKLELESLEKSNLTEEHGQPVGSLKSRDHDKKKKLETESLEKSNLTEEHAQPVGSQNSSDSTLNSSKRHKPSSPPESCHNSGSIIRIRLPLQRHKDPEMSLPSKEQPGPAAGRTDNQAFVQGQCEIAPRQGREQGEQHQPCSTPRNASQEVDNLRLSKVKQSHTSKAVDNSHKSESVVPTPSKSSSRRTLSRLYQINDLIENWVPPPMQDTDFGDEKWLSETKQNPNNGVERCKTDNDTTSYGPSTLWPQAHFLPAADIYALPYAVMF